MSKLISNLPNLVKAYRAENNLTQKDFAALVRDTCGINFDDTMVSRIENNITATRIDLGTAQTLREVIGFGLDEIIVEEE